MVGSAAVAFTGVVGGALLMSNVFSPVVADAGSTGRVDDVALAEVIDHQSGRYLSLDGVWLDGQLREVLPNVQFAIDGSPARPAFDGVVQGQVTAVAEGASYRDEIGPDNARAVEVPFNSPDATWRMIVLTIDVANDFDPTTQAAETVQLGVAFDGGADTESMMSAFQGRQVLAVLDKPGALVPDQTLRTAARSGALLGFVAGNGSISMPFLGAGEHGYLGELTTLETVIAEAKKPESTIHVTFNGSYQRLR